MTTWGKQYKVLCSTNVRGPCVLSTHTLLKIHTTMARSLHSTSSNPFQIPMFFSFSSKVSSSSSRVPIVFISLFFFFFSDAVISLSPVFVSFSLVFFFYKIHLFFIFIHLFYLIGVEFFVCLVLSDFYLICSFSPFFSCIFAWIMITPLWRRTVLGRDWGIELEWQVTWFDPVFTNAFSGWYGLFCLRKDAHPPTSPKSCILTFLHNKVKVIIPHPL